MRNATKNLLVVLLLGALLGQCVFGMLQKSAAYDEPANLGAGYFYLKTGSFGINPDHPPFLNILAATPLLFSNLKAYFSPEYIRTVGEIRGRRDKVGQAFYVGRRILFDTNVGADTVLLLSRLPIVLLSLLLGFFIFAWARELYGFGAGILALFLYAFNPNILAHAQLVTNDVGSACFIFISTYYFWKFMNTSGAKSLVMLGFTLGLALSSHFSALMLLPIFFLSALYFFLAGKTHFPFKSENIRNAIKNIYVSRIAEFLISGAAVLVLGFVVILLCYGIVSVRWYFYGISNLLEHTKNEQMNFLLGRTSTKGWWYYFPLAFLIKTPIPFLTLILLSLLLIPRLPAFRMEKELFLIAPLVAFLSVWMMGNINIGIRYLLSIHPFLFVLTARVVRAEIKGKKALLCGIILLCAWQVFSCAKIYPHYLAYFNELIGGPDNGHKYLSDSNIDWGQDLKGLGKYMKKEGIEGVFLAYFGVAQPDSYGVKYQWLPSDGYIPYSTLSVSPARKLIAISVKCLQGVNFPDRRYEWLERYKPAAKIGYSIFIYDITGKTDAYFNLARIYAATGSLDLAEKELKDILAIEPGNLLAKENIARIRKAQKP